MSCDKWRYTEQCEGRPCPGDCDECSFNPDEVTIQPPTVDYKWEEFDDETGAWIFQIDKKPEGKES